MEKHIKRLVSKRPIVCYTKKVWSYDVPDNYTILVNNGQSVTSGQPLAKGFVPSEVIDIDIKEFYGIESLSNIKKFIKKEEGEVVEKDAVILSVRLKGEKVVLKSPIDGVFSLKRIDDGLITIIGPIVEKKIMSAQKGIVMVSGGKIKIASKGYTSRCVTAGYCSSEERYIEGIWHLVEDIDAVTRSEIEDKIVWTTRGIIITELERLCALGARVVVSPSIIVEKWADMIWLFKGVANWMTWYGFGESRLSNSQIMVLKRWNGTLVILDKAKKEIGFPELKKKVAKKRRIERATDLEILSVGSRVAVVEADNIEIGKITGFDQEGCFGLEVGKKERRICGGVIFMV